MLKALHALPGAPVNVRQTLPSFTRFALKKMSSMPTPKLNFPKFISVEGSDIHYRSKPDGTIRLIPFITFAAAVAFLPFRLINLRKMKSGFAGFRFSLVSYNILAQVYVKSSLFPHSPSPILRWKSRSTAILDVLKNLGADFLCLQEVDEYDSYYKNPMQSVGYSSIYMKRSGQKRDGCGLFYKHDVAELILEQKIEYNDLVNTIKTENLSNGECKDDKSNKQEDMKIESGVASKRAPEDRGDPNDPCVRLKRDCVGILAAFKLKAPNPHFVIVANTHIYWDPEWVDVKLAQAKYLLARLAEFKTLVSDKFECTPHVIVAGDFNSTPGDPVYQYLVSGSSSSPVPVLECLEELPLALSSVYAFTRGEPPFTNYTPGFTGTLDYILFSPSDDIKPVSVLELPEPDSPDIVGGLPNYSHPSDHLPIGAEFEIIME